MISRDSNEWDGGVERIDGICSPHSSASPVVFIFFFFCGGSCTEADSVVNSKVTRRLLFLPLLGKVVARVTGLAVSTWVSTLLEVLVLATLLVVLVVLVATLLLMLLLASE